MNTEFVILIIIICIVIVSAVFPNIKKRIRRTFFLSSLSFVIIISVYIAYKNPNKNNIIWQDETHGFFTDKRDRQKYKVVKTGSQIWFAENFNYYTGKGSWVYASDDVHPATDSKNTPIYHITYNDGCGRLYSWETAKLISPEGWHLPSNNEWEILENHLGLDTVDINPSLFYNDYEINFHFCGSYIVNNTNKHSDTGIFFNKGKSAYYWTSTGTTENKAYSREISYNSIKRNKYADIQNGYSARYIKNQSGPFIFSCFNCHKAYR